MLVTIISILIFTICALIGFAVMQIKMAGMNVKDFWSFIKANEILDDLYIFSKREGELSPQEQIIFLMEAEKVFQAFEKVPNILWDEEYSKYREVLNQYQKIRLVRWASN